MDGMPILPVARRILKPKHTEIGCWKRLKVLKSSFQFWQLNFNWGNYMKLWQAIKALSEEVTAGLTEQRFLMAPKEHAPRSNPNHQSSHQISKSLCLPLMGTTPWLFRQNECEHSGHASRRPLLHSLWKHFSGPNKSGQHEVCVPMAHGRRKVHIGLSRFSRNDHPQCMKKRLSASQANISKASKSFGVFGASGFTASDSLQRWQVGCVDDRWCGTISNISLPHPMPSWKRYEQPWIAGKWPHKAQTGFQWFPSTAKTPANSLTRHGSNLEFVGLTSDREPILTKCNVGCHQLHEKNRENHLDDQEHLEASDASFVFTRRNMVWSCSMKGNDLI